MKRLCILLLVGLCSSALVACVTVVESRSCSDSCECAGRTTGGLAETNARGANEAGLRGVVVDEAGLPLRAKVHLVSESGSQSKGTTSQGEFEFFHLGSNSYAMTVTTKDGRIASIAHVQLPSKYLRVPVLEEGSRLILYLRGRQSLRYEISIGDTMLFNFSAREGKESKLVIPVGKVRVRLYGRDYSEEKFVNSALGHQTRLSF